MYNRVEEKKESKWRSIWLLRHASAEAAMKEVSGCSMGGAFYAFNSSKERTTPSDGKARYPALSLGQTECGSHEPHSVFLPTGDAP